MSSRPSSGFTLIEMVIAIVVIGIGLAGVLLAIDTTVRSSADPLIRKQMLAIAEEILEEALLKPFSTTGTAPTNQETPFAQTPSRMAFDDVSDYHGYQTRGICDIAGNAIVGLGAYDLAVRVDNAELGDISILSGNARQISVTVSHSGENLTLSGFRTNYAQ